MHFEQFHRFKSIYLVLNSKNIAINRNEDIEPFFIVGSGRCGTTLLRRILTAIDRIHIPPENWALSPIIQKFKRYRWFNDWTTIVDLTVAAHCHSTQGWFDHLPTDFIKNANDCSENERSLAWLINDIYRFHAKKMNVDCYRWGDKTPSNVNCMNQILDVFPKAKFIHMIRDGVDVVHSWKKIGYYGTNITKPAQRWLSAINSADIFRKKYPHKIIEIRYENFVQYPSREIEKICDFLGLVFRDNILKMDRVEVAEDLKKINHYNNVLKPITTSYLGKGRKELSSKEKRKLSVLMNDSLKKMGYPPV